MSSSGPTGAAAPPPQWLSSASLPVDVFAGGSIFVRIHRSNRSPVFFSPGDGRPASGRFDSATGKFGVLYAAMSFEGAFAETVLRNPSRLIVSMGEIAARSCTLLASSRGIKLVRLHGDGLQRIGVDNAITTGPYGPCGIWADALYGHRDGPDGIAYASRHDPAQICIAIFSRSDLTVTPSGVSIPLVDTQREVAAVMRRYEKGLDATQ